MESYTLRKALVNMVTTTATPLRPWMRPIAPSERVQFRFVCYAHRPDTGSRKVWEVQGIALRNGSITYPRGVVGLTTPTHLPQRDAPHVAGCSVAVVDTGDSFGMEFTGPNGVEIHWAVTAIDVKDPEV